MGSHKRANRQRRRVGSTQDLTNGKRDDPKENDPCFQRKA